MNDNQSTDLGKDIKAHIHMLGCQAISEARNLGYAEGKGTKEDDGDLLDMIEKHEDLLENALQELLLKEVNLARISELKQLEPPEQYEEYAKLMGSEYCRICGFNAIEFRKHIEDRLAHLSSNSEAREGEL